MQHKYSTGFVITRCSGSQREKVRCVSETAMGQEKELQLFSEDTKHYGQMWVRKQLCCRWHLLQDPRESQTSTWPALGRYLSVKSVQDSEFCTSMKWGFLQEYNDFSAFSAICFRWAASFPSGSPGGLQGDSSGYVFYPRGLFSAQPKRVQVFPGDLR